MSEKLHWSTLYRSLETSRKGFTRDCSGGRERSSRREFAARYAARYPLAVRKASSTQSSPTTGLLLGLVLTLAAVLVYSLYTRSQLAGLRALQSDMVDRNRKDSLQLLRVQNDLNSLGPGHARHAGRARAVSAHCVDRAIRTDPRRSGRRAASSKSNFHLRLAPPTSDSISASRWRNFGMRSIACSNWLAPARKTKRAIKFD